MITAKITVLTNVSFRLIRHNYRETISTYRFATAGFSITLLIVKRNLTPSALASRLRRSRSPQAVGRTPPFKTLATGMDIKLQNWFGPVRSSLDKRDQLFLLHTRRSRVSESTTSLSTATSSLFFPLFVPL
ncbi:hypothetical protein Bbelb_333730 [Branchiostoma belcheri]|nr:hypothetical protein Bbelb_333730 [Branchiostoma belcheri]